MANRGKAISYLLPSKAKAWFLAWGLVLPAFWQVFGWRPALVLGVFAALPPIALLLWAHTIAKWTRRSHTQPTAKPVVYETPRPAKPRRFRFEAVSSEVISRYSSPQAMLNESGGTSIQGWVDHERNAVLVSRWKSSIEHRDDDDIYTFLWKGEAIGFEVRQKRKSYDTPARTVIYSVVFDIPWIILPPSLEEEREEFFQALLEALEDRYDVGTPAGLDLLVQRRDGAPLRLRISGKSNHADA